MESVSTKLEIMDIFNGWNDKNERIIITIGENSASYKWMHEQSAKNYNNINKILNLLMIIFSTSLSAETIFTQSIHTELLGILIVKNIIIYIITILSVIQNFLKYEKLASSHISSAMKFSTLYHSIQQEMCMYRRNRKKATEYISNTIKQYDSLVLNSPNINNNIIEQFKKIFKTDLPEIADKQKIDIVIEDPEHLETKQKDLNLCNLNKIHNIYQIQGEISDNDIQNCSGIELQEIKQKYKIV